MKLFRILFVVLFVLLLAGCTLPLPAAIQTSSAVQIPPILVDILNGFLAMLFATAFIYFFEISHIDLRGLATPLAFAVGGGIVFWVQYYIDLAPVSYDPWIEMIFKILVVILVPVGTLRLFARQPATLLPKK